MGKYLFVVVTVSMLMFLRDSGSCGITFMSVCILL
jgi:hypothetical protein